MGRELNYCYECKHEKDCHETKDEYQLACYNFEKHWMARLLSPPMWIIVLIFVGLLIWLVKMEG